MDKPINRTGVSKIKAHHFENGASNGHLIYAEDGIKAVTIALVTPLSLALPLLDRKLCVLTFQFSLPLSCDCPYWDKTASPTQ
jgi:hypothetical protein